ncbi:(-)-germacrene D synthase-like isoform X1 [Rhodamnia argentea]|uniref:(-)-germacrene D synthase-like isoform X1 n=1 Tax=Rhodamnia argentea TaxID=178133 RepID=A0ABM3HIF7_9MYRT|nr:(-)-germacrene D synthase-like isoform X1 [Rhodamnia argentea]
MSLRISAIPSSPPNEGTGPAVRRRSAGYHPSIWGDHFLKYASPSPSLEFKFLGRVEERVEEPKGEVRKMLTNVADKPSQMLLLIDQIQRLGIEYHFERDMDEQLEQIHKSYSQLDHADFRGDDLHMVALIFRLLRQQGYNISSDVFNKFKDSEGNFRESLINDVGGLLSLYEACRLRCHGDSILEEALSFATTYLESINENKVSTSLAKQVSHALKQPLRKGLPRLEARHYIPLYQEDPSHDEVLLALAKLDFNLLQEQHQKELGKITRWWKAIDVPRNFPFARDRIVELFFWISGVYFEPEFALARDILTKVIALTSILDDIYDVYGTLEELALITEAIQKWDVDAMDGQPEYMQAYYKELLHLYEEIGNELAIEGRSYRLVYAKEAMKKQARAYYQEAKWFHTKYTPTLKEYMPLQLITTGYGLLSTTSLVGMGDVVTKHTFEWASGDCKIVKAAETICRLMDDISSHHFEQKRGHLVSAVELLMKERSMSELEAEKEIRKGVIDAWKDTNEEFLRPTAVPASVLTRVLNFSRAMDVMYTNGDHYTHSGTKLKGYVTLLFVSPLPM